MKVSLKKARSLRTTEGGRSDWALVQFIVIPVIPAPIAAAASAPNIAAAVVSSGACCRQV